MDRRSRNIHQINRNYGRNVKMAPTEHIASSSPYPEERGPGDRVNRHRIPHVVAGWGRDMPARPHGRGEARLSHISRS